MYPELYRTAPRLIDFGSKEYLDIGTIFRFNINAYRKYNPQEYKYRKIDTTSEIGKLINRYDIQMPEEIVLRPVEYSTWRIHRSFHHDTDNISKILSESIVRITPSDFDLMSLVERRPAFWKNLFLIIQQISKYNVSDKEEEEQLVKMIRSAGLWYRGTLDGCYDMFVFQNFRDMWEYYRKLEYYERLDMIALFQEVSGVDVYERLEEVRRGIRKILRLTPEAPSNVPRDKKLDEKGIPPEAILESTEKLREAMRRDQMVPKKRKVHTRTENIEFMDGEGK